MDLKFVFFICVISTAATFADAQCGSKFIKNKIACLQGNGKRMKSEVMAAEVEEPVELPFFKKTWTGLGRQGARMPHPYLPLDSSWTRLGRQGARMHHPYPQPVNSRAYKSIENN